MEEHYSNRELREMFNDIKKELAEIRIQTTKTNGRVTWLERIVYTIGVVTLTILAVRGSELIALVKLLI